MRESESFHIGGSWKTLAEDLSYQLKCDVQYSDFGWMVLDIPFSMDSFIVVILYVEWSVRKGEGLIKGYSEDLDKPAFVCGKLRADTLRVDSASVAARINSVISN